MKTILLPLLVALALVGAACGDDATEVGTDPTDDGTVVEGDGADAPTDPDDTDPDDTDGEGDGAGGDVGELPPLGAGPYPIADLTVTIEPDGDGAGEIEPITYRLACLGDTATVTGDGAPGSAEEMCLALQEDAIRDRILNGPPADQACTMQYGGPQVATITGTLDDEPVDARFHRADGCGIGDWDLLAEFLPEAT